MERDSRRMIASERPHAELKRFPPPWPEQDNRQDRKETGRGALTRQEFHDVTYPVLFGGARRCDLRWDRGREPIAS